MCYTHRAFIARKIRINPPEICRVFEERFFILLPQTNPVTDIKNDVIPMIEHANNRFVPVSFRVAPETSASILVATPSPTRHLNPIHAASSFCCPKASVMNFNPKIKKMAKTIHLLYGTRSLYKPCVPR